MYSMDCHRVSRLRRFPTLTLPAAAQIRLDITASVPYSTVYLRVIDPPDLAPYVQPVSCVTVTGCDCGIEGQNCDNKDIYSNWGFGSEKHKTASITVDDEGKGSITLFTTHRYAGDNYQVQASYQSLSQEAPFTNAHIKASSGIITAWKRVFVERDRMFKRGGLLAVDALDGQSSVKVAKIWDQGTSKWVRADNLVAGDSVAVFDTEFPFERLHDEGCVIGLDPTDDQTRWIIVTLGNLACQGGFALAHDYSCSVDASGAWDFSAGRSAALGVIHSDDGQITDTSANQINGTGSAFYDADLRDIQQPFDDGFVQFIGRPEGDGAVPYIPNNLPGFYVLSSGGGSAEPGRTYRRMYQKAWFNNYDTINYVHLLGVRGPNSADSSVAGFTWRWSLYAMIHVETASQIVSDPVALLSLLQMCNDHELGHLLKANICSGHDNPPRPAWCNTDLPQSCAGQPCLMQDGAGGPPYDRDTINRFCKEDLLYGDPDLQCGGPGTGNGAIRVETDLIKSE
jgi:hypothetical protein